MREAELITKIVIDQAMPRAVSVVRPEFFIAFPDEWAYLDGYFKQFRKTPNEATFVADNLTFPWSPTEFDVEYLADELRQDHVGRTVAKLLEETKEAAEINPSEATRLLLAQGQELLSLLGDSAHDRVDLREKAHTRYEHLRNLEVVDGLSGLTHGFALLDKKTRGTQEGEMELYFARPGMGKTSILLYGAYRAWKDQGAVVSFISTEMDESEIGYKFDSFAFNIAQSLVQSGQLPEDEWMRYAEELSDWAHGEHPGFFFREAGGLGRSFSTADLASVIKRDKPDLVCVDGLVFLEPVRREFKDVRTKLTLTIEELKQLVTTTRARLRLTHQANRESEIRTSRRSKTLTFDELMPNVHNLAEADATGQFANRAFAIKRIRNRTYIAIRKNRNGPENILVSFAFDADKGVIDEVRHEMMEGKLDDELNDSEASRPTTSSGKLVPF